MNTITLPVAWTKMHWIWRDSSAIISISSHALGSYWKAVRMERALRALAERAAASCVLLVIVDSTHLGLVGSVSCLAENGRPRSCSHWPSQSCSVFKSALAVLLSSFLTVPLAVVVRNGSGSLAWQASLHRCNIQRTQERRRITWHGQLVILPTNC